MARREALASALLDGLGQVLERRVGVVLIRAVLKLRQAVLDGLP